MIEQASSLRGFLVVAVHEGAQLGAVSSIQVDAVKRGVVGFVYRTRWLGGDERFIPIDNVTTVGRDVLLVDRESSIVTPTEESPAPGRSLKELQGLRVTADDGTYLGTLVDLEFSEDDWRISSITLAEDKRLPVDAETVRLGDEVIVPAAAKDGIQSTAEERHGFLSRMLGREAVEDTKAALRRAVGREESASNEESNKSERHPD